MRIRAAIASDIPQMKRLILESPSAAQWNDADYASLFNSSQPALRTALVMEESGAMFGFITARSIGSEWELENIAVAIASRNKRIGKQLADELFKLAQSQGASAIHLEVRESNQAARRLYQSCGFQETGRRRSYYNNPQEDAILYSFSFSSPKK